jgi:hypothetical protein
MVLASSQALASAGSESGKRHGTQRNALPTTLGKSNSRQPLIFLFLLRAPRINQILSRRRLFQARPHTAMLCFTRLRKFVEATVQNL